MERRSMEPTLLDGLTAELGGPRTAAFLEKVDRAINFEALAQEIRRDVAPEQPAGGRPFLPVLLMIKALMLAKWYGLSDEQLEDQLMDRLSFRRFVGLSVHEQAPDATSFVNFRKRLRETGHLATLYDGVLEQLQDKGLGVQEGSVVDSTIVEKSRGQTREDGSSTRDACASYTRKHGRAYHGYKAHVRTSMDGLITDYIFDTAKVHDSKHIDALTEDETVAVYADSAYMSQERSNKLKERGVHDGIVQRRVRGQEDLTPEQRAHNHACSKVRARGEHPFAWMTQMGYVRARYRGLQRNGFDFGLTAMAYNIKRSLSLLGMRLSPLKPAT